METELTLCDSCQRDYTSSHATVFCFDCRERLCDQCDKHHKRNKASSSHKTQKLEDVKDVDGFDTLKELTKCSVHSEEIIKYLCQDHDQLCCNECAIIGHRTCVNVVSLAEEIEKTNKNASPPVEDNFKVLNNYADQLMRHEITEQTKIENTEEACKKALETLKKNMETAYKNIEDKINAISEKSRNTIKRRVTNQKSEIQKYSEDLNKSIQKLETVKQIGQDVHVYITRREMRLRLKAMENRLIDLSKNVNRHEQVIIEASTIPKLQAYFDKFIAVQVKATNVSLQIYDIKKLHVLRPVKVITYPVKLEALKLETPRPETLRGYKPKKLIKELIIGCTWLGRFLIVSNGYKVSVLIDIAGMPDIIQCQLMLANRHLVTAVDDMRIAAAVKGVYPNVCVNLYRLNDVQRNLESISEVVSVQEEIVGIAYDIELRALIVLSNKGTVEFYSLDGKKIESFTSGNLERLLKFDRYRKCFILFDSNTKILYCTDNSTLIATTMDDRLSFKYKLPESVLGSPVLDAEGNIYYPVRENGQTVIQIISTDGKLIHSFQVCSGAVSFVTICFNTAKDKLAVLSDEYKQELKFFDIWALMLA